MNHLTDTEVLANPGLICPKWDSETAEQWQARALKQHLRRQAEEISYRGPDKDWQATLRYCERQWQDERGVMLDRLAAVRKVRDSYASQAKFADHEPASYFREFVRRLDDALKVGAS